MATYIKQNDLNVQTPSVRPPDVDRINPPQPNTRYQSQIDTSAPLKADFLRLLTDVKMPHRPTAGTPGYTSRSAFANALLRDMATKISTDADRFNVAQMTQAEKSRAEDILSQRQSAHDRFRMDDAYDTFVDDTLTRYTQGMMDLKAQYAREKKEARASITAAIL